MSSTLWCGGRWECGCGGRRGEGRGERGEGGEERGEGGEGRGERGEGRGRRGVEKMCIHEGSEMCGENYKKPPSIQILLPFQENVPLFTVLEVSLVPTHTHAH